MLLAEIAIPIGVTSSTEMRAEWAGICLTGSTCQSRLAICSVKLSLAMPLIAAYTARLVVRPANVACRVAREPNSNDGDGNAQDEDEIKR